MSEENILFLNIICVNEGLIALKEAYKNVKVLTCAVDIKLNKHKYIVPGLGYACHLCLIFVCLFV